MRASTIPFLQFIVNSCKAIYSVCDSETCLEQVPFLFLQFIVNSYKAIYGACAISSFVFFFYSLL